MPPRTIVVGMKISDVIDPSTNASNVPGIVMMSGIVRSSKSMNVAATIKISSTAWQKKIVRRGRFVATQELRKAELLRQQTSRLGFEPVEPKHRQRKRQLDQQRADPEPAAMDR